MHRIARASLLIGISLVTGCAMGPPAHGVGGKTQLFDNLGSYEYPVTTNSPEAQQYFNQGVIWTWSFNHDEAVRAFTKATELDPDCAMAWWGIAHAQGPNYNDSNPYGARNTAAWKANQKALAALNDETDKERALIEAQAKRCPKVTPKDREEITDAYASAMGKVWKQHPDDAQIATLYAEALMLRNPWKLHRFDGSAAREETHTIVAVLERAIALDDSHPGANHLMIHALEMSTDKQRAVAAADRLSTLVPGSGHMRHMPSHIYAQVGMWDRSVKQNQLAMESDDAYRTLAQPRGRQRGYMAHNTHMLAFSAMMVGDEETAMAAARSIWEQNPPSAFKFETRFLDPLYCIKYDVMKRFGRWQEIIDEPAPPSYLMFTNTIWRAHRAIAYAALREVDKAKSEQAKLRRNLLTAGGSMMPDRYRLMFVQFLLVSEHFVQGEIALAEGELEDAAAHLEQAVMLEDTLGYGEPPRWLQPSRHALGAVLLKQKRYADAEVVYRDDLKKWPRNGWSLLGLSQALAGQGDEGSAAVVRADLDKVWRGAENGSSCKCVVLTSDDTSKSKGTVQVQ